MDIILVTDLHLRDPAISEADAAHARFIARGLSLACRGTPGAALAILLGDLTDAGEDAAYAWLRDRLEDLPVPVIPMLGNHDDRGAFNRLFGNPDGTFCQSSFGLGHTRLVCLDTLKPGALEGELCQERLDWLDGELASATSACLFMHHPPFEIGDDDLDPIRLENPERLAAVVNRHGNVRQIFCGHIHREFFGLWNGIACHGLDCARATISGEAPPLFASAVARPAGDALAVTGMKFVP